MTLDVDLLGFGFKFTLISETDDPLKVTHALFKVKFIARIRFFTSGIISMSLDPLKNI
jgi:hypothetical protein